MITRWRPGFERLEGHDTRSEVAKTTAYPETSDTIAMRLASAEGGLGLEETYEEQRDAEARLLGITADEWTFLRMGAREPVDVTVPELCAVLRGRGRVAA